MSEHEQAALITGDCDHAGEIRRVTIVGMVVNVLLSIVKVAGGLLLSSQVLIADGVHSLSDLSSDIAILIGVKYWNQPADDSHPHGHRRLEPFVTFSIGLLLVVTALGLLWSAVKAMAGKPPAELGTLALIPAALSVLAKEALFRWTIAAGRRIRSMPLVANAWHHRSDALSSLVALVAIAGATMGPRWAFLDPVGTIVISIFILKAAWDIAGNAFNKLIDASASQDRQEAITAVATGVNDVRSVHDVRTRFLGCHSLAVDLHIQVDGSLTVSEGHVISGKVKRALLEGDLDVVDVVVHIEPCEHETPAGGPP